MFSGGNRTTAPTWNVRDEKLTLRPYNQALSELTSSLCAELGQKGQDTCLFETRTAFDCLLRHRVRKGGDLEDNIGQCKHHIDNMKAHVSRSDYTGRLLDEKLSSLNDMRQSFV